MIYLVKNLVLLVLFVSFNCYAHDSVENRIWNKNAIDISIPVGKDRRIEFPTSVEVSVDESMSQKIEIVNIRGGSVFIKPLDKMENVKVIFNDMSNKNYWVIRISTSNKAHTHPVRINDVRSVEDINSKNTKNSDKILDPISLIRFASTQFYGPERLKMEDSRISGSYINMGEIDFYSIFGVNQTVHGVWNAEIAGEKLYVTAILVENTLSESVILDPREVKYDILYLGGQYNILEPASYYPQNSTYVYAVSRHPLVSEEPIYE